MSYLQQIKLCASQKDYEIKVEQIDKKIRILDLPVRIWSREEWISHIKNVNFKYSDKPAIIQQLSLPFNQKLRQLIYPWIASCVETPYELFIERKSFSSPQDQIIFLDIERTLSTLAYFKGKKKESTANKTFIDDKWLDHEFTSNQKRLFYILRAYANIDSTIGYVQGMNNIAGSILYSLDVQPSNQLDVDAKVLQVLLYINYTLNWRQTYSKSMKKLKSMVNHFQNLLKENLPKVHQVLGTLDIPFLIFIDQQFFTLMSYKLPFEFSIKVLDLFLIQGEQIIFEVLLRSYVLNEGEILQFEDKDDLIGFVKDIVQISLDKYGISALIPQHKELIL